MNVNDFVTRHYEAQNGDADKLARLYLDEALTLGDDERYAALLPAIRSLSSTTCSRLRKAIRGNPPMTETYATDSTAGGASTPSPPKVGTEASAPTAQDGVLAWLTRQESNHSKIHVDGVGVISVLDATRQQWALARQKAEDLARGFSRTAAEYAQNIALIDQTPGATCLRDVLDARRAA
jgi:hypothetical protein